MFHSPLLYIMLNDDGDGRHKSWLALELWEQSNGHGLVISRHALDSIEFAALPLRYFLFCHPNDVRYLKKFVQLDQKSQTVTDFIVSQLSFSKIFTSQKLFESHQFNRIMTIRTIDYRFLSNFRSNYFNLVVILDFRFYNWTNWSSKKYVLISLSHALLCPNGWINNVFTF